MEAEKQRCPRCEGPLQGGRCPRCGESSQPSASDAPVVGGYPMVPDQEDGSRPLTTTGQLPMPDLNHGSSDEGSHRSRVAITVLGLMALVLMLFFLKEQLSVFDRSGEEPPVNTQIAAELPRGDVQVFALPSPQDASDPLRLGPAPVRVAPSRFEVFVRTIGGDDKQSPKLLDLLLKPGTTCWVPPRHGKRLILRTRNARSWSHAVLKLCRWTGEHSQQSKPRPIDAPLLLEVSTSVGSHKRPISAREDKGFVRIDLDGELSDELLISLPGTIGLDGISGLEFHAFLEKKE